MLFWVGFLPSASPSVAALLSDDIARRPIHAPPPISRLGAALEIFYTGIKVIDLQIANAALSSIMSQFTAPNSTPQRG